MHDVVMKLTTEPFFVTVLPFTIDDFKGNVFIRWSGTESQDAEVFVVGTGRYGVLRRGIFVDQIRKEDVEFVALDNLRGRVVHIIMGLIVLVPLETRMDAIKITRLARTVFIRP